MLDTLYQFGQHLSKDSSRQEFTDLIFTPTVDEKERAKGLEFLVAEVIFDLDAGTFRVNQQPRAFDDSDTSAKWSPYNLRCLKNLGANAKNIYPTVDPRKHFDQWKKSLFGKEDKNGSTPKASELGYSIQKDFPALAETPVCRAAAEIFKMRAAFETAFPEWKKVTEALNWSEKSRAVLLFASVVSTDLGCPEPAPVAQLDGFDAFLRLKLLQKNLGEEGSGEGKAAAAPKLCYVTGTQAAGVGEASFNSRYSLNKMFVTTTKNYASGFDDKDFSKNYQASGEAQTLLERGSKYVLDNLTVKIAGLDHCILPQFRGGQVLDFEGRAMKLKDKSELLFTMHKRDAFKGVAHDFKGIADGELYWITFLGYETDSTKSKYFKTINLIKDISKTHFENVILVLQKVDNEMSEMLGEHWDKAMTFTKDKEKTRADFNFLTVFNLIPVRREKDKRNVALAIFKAILERRRVSRQSIFQHFSELIQLHRFGRGGYNILPMSKDYFDTATRNAVFQYQAFFLFLKKIKLLDMEEKTTPSAATLEEKNAAIAAFFERMGYSDEQRAVFYLGQILNNVGYAQSKKGHPSKPVLGKVNYNGMDAAALKRLQADLFEKCRQYDILKFNEGNFSKVVALFDAAKNEVWDKGMKAEESLFFLLSGYSFRAPGEAKDDPDTPATEPEI